MTKSELVQRIADKQSLLAIRDVDLAVKTMLDHMTACLIAQWSGKTPPGFVPHAIGLIHPLI